MTVTVVGAGLGGLRTCETLRRLGYDEAITLVGDELHPPYSKPPLSKEVLRGDAGFDGARLRNDEEIAKLDLTLRLGTAAVGLDAANHRVSLDDGSSIASDHVVLATGAKPRTLPNVDLPGVHVLRTIDHCTALQTALGPDARVVVIGAGFIGLEVAASARTLGAHVTVVDVLPHPLDRVLDADLSATISAVHREHGVEFRLGARIAEIAGDGQVERVVLLDGEVLPATVVVVGIGVEPETDWLVDSGVELDNGVICDGFLSAAPGVWAVGDLCRWRDTASGHLRRIEHWSNATEQAQSVARSIVGGAPEAFSTIPYFWSDQYDAKLQSLGFVTKGDEYSVVSGSLDEPKWVAIIRDGDRLGGVVGMRMTGKTMKFRPLLEAGASWDEALTFLAAT